MWLQAVGNAVVDRFLNVGDGELAALGVQKGDGDFGRSPEEIENLIKHHGPGDLKSGGSVANVVRILGQLGVPVGFVGRTADDKAGHEFVADMAVCEVDCPSPETGETGTFEVLCLNTPDGERTFVAASSVNLPLTGDKVIELTARKADWVLIEGYLLFAQAEAALAAMQLAKSRGQKVALTLATPAVVAVCWAALAEMIEAEIDLIFANSEEMEALVHAAQIHDEKEAAELAKSIVQTDRVVTYGGEGAVFLGKNGDKVEVPCSFNPQPVDTTGAGDAFAAGFLYGLHQGAEKEVCLTYGHTLAHKVIGQVGARLENITSDVFK